ncbi:MAG TPA: metallophosphoesterase [Kouleothrix sp.]|uniref:metallophosphoesterase n=1 Tax=Kouleothrix sp. TaxID=2779161 RepID=UPI002BEF4130|nr:metallophosphoesterase [Kouleothrix sp.]HRC74525.1 metallophosphoesterase [Kouleothrix sp.]
MISSGPLYIVGDIHGQYDKLAWLLRASGLVDDELAWMGGAARLWFMGDFFDRGPAAIETIDLVMRLQAEAFDAGGQVEALIGNHEPLILSALRFGETRTEHSGTFLWSWRRNGGNDDDLARLTARHVEWISSLPAMALVDDMLLIHADATFYSSYGATIEQVNRGFRALLHTDDAAAWDRLLDQFGERKAFDDSDPDGTARAAQMLADFGGRRIVHGHTPISYVRHCFPEEVIEPLVYAGGLCVNVDGGMYLDGPGFIYRPADGWVLHGVVVAPDTVTSADDELL